MKLQEWYFHSIKGNCLKSKEVICSIVCPKVLELYGFMTAMEGFKRGNEMNYMFSLFETYILLCLEMAEYGSQEFDLSSPIS